MTRTLILTEPFEDDLIAPLIYTSSKNRVKWNKNIREIRKYYEKLTPWRVRIIRRLLSEMKDMTIEIKEYSNYKIISNDEANLLIKNHNIIKEMICLISNMLNAEQPKMKAITISKLKDYQEYFSSLCDYCGWIEHGLRKEKKMNETLTVLKDVAIPIINLERFSYEIKPYGEFKTIAADSQKNGYSKDSRRLLKEYYKRFSIKKFSIFERNRYDYRSLADSYEERYDIYEKVKNIFFNSASVQKYHKNDIIGSELMENYYSFIKISHEIDLMSVWYHETFFNTFYLSDEAKNIDDSFVRNKANGKPSKIYEEDI